MDETILTGEAPDHAYSAHLAPEAIFWDRDANQWIYKLLDVTLTVTNIPGQPVTVYAASDTMHRKFLDPMRAQLRAILEEAIDSGLDTASFAVLLLRLAEESVSWIQHWKSHEAKQLQDGKGEKQSQWSEGWDAKGSEGWQSFLDNPYGVDLDTVDDTAQHLLGQSIKDICKIIPSWLRVLHVEPVFRGDLVSRFVERRQKMVDELSQMSYGQLRQCVSNATIIRGSTGDTRKELAKELCRPRVTFHGAPRQVVSSIVQYGFIKPGDKVGKGSKLSTRCGSSYGTGIYSSPDPAFASSYMNIGSRQQPGDIPGYRLIVCATLLGRPLEVSRDEALRKSELLVSNAHSHISPNRYEYVVFDAAQIIPCYVLHLDYGADAARREFDKMPTDPNDMIRQQSRTERKQRTEVEKRQEELWPAAVQAKKQAMKAAAQKWFPHGFGPATGTNFVIEEIGEVSDDEEIYGEFQGLRIENEREVQQKEDWRAAGGSWFDEYQTVRKSGKELART